MATSVLPPCTTPAPGATGRILPGLSLALLVAAGLVALATRLPSTVSPLLLAIVAGAVAANAGLVPAAAQPGLAVAGRRVLRIGIVLLGLQLALRDVVDLGWRIIAGVVMIVAGGIATCVVAGRILRMSPTQALLIGCGFSICGAAAVAAADGVIEEHDETETVTAVALVVLFGTAMIALVPAMASLGGLSPHRAGVLAGGSIHEVAQVVAAGGVLSGPAGGTALTAAVLVKLTRVLLLAPVLFVLSVVQRRRTTVTAWPAVRRPPLVPLFVLGFCAMVAVRSTGLVPPGVLAPAKVAQTVLLTAAMFALGCSVRVIALRRAGGRPLLLGLVATTVVTGLAYGVAVSS